MGLSRFAGSGNCREPGPALASGGTTFLLAPRCSESLERHIAAGPRAGFARKALAGTAAARVVRCAQMLPRHGVEAKSRRSAVEATPPAEVHARLDR
jgi:hypothetical protein